MPQPSLPTPPAPAAFSESPTHNSLSPGARAASPRPARKSKKAASPSGGYFGGLIEGTVPPINVLIVEDNVINQKLLEAFMKRLSVRWQCAANGEIAVQKWRQGGFHLVLMDIQLPVMNGLDATKEIRRLERLNGIGVFSKTASGRLSAASTTSGHLTQNNTLKEEDVLGDLSLFKSPVIIVALTASSLQSDRHEALAAGCNDFLTKVCLDSVQQDQVIILTSHPARWISVAGAKGYGMGLHASSDRLRRLAQMAWLRRPAASLGHECQSGLEVPLSSKRQHRAGFPSIEPQRQKQGGHILI